MLTILRVALTGFALLAVAWGVTTLPGAWSSSATARIAARITGGVSFRPDVLESLLSAPPATPPRPEDRRARAIVALRLAELAVGSGDRAAAANAVDRLAEAIDASLSATPTDAYLWLALYWVKSRVLGANAQTFPYLRASYKYGPNEGWIASRRVLWTLAAYATAPDDLQRAAVADFSGLVSSGLYKEAADALLGPGWIVRQTLLDSIAALPGRERDAFMNEVDRRGYDIDLPGLQRRDVRPWR